MTVPQHSVNGYYVGVPAPTLKLDDFLPYRLSVTSNLVSDAIAHTYDSLFGLRIPEWRLIAVLAEHAGITQQDLCARTRMDKVTVSRAAIALQARGLVVKSPNCADRRSHLLALGDSGRALYAQVAPKALELEHRIFGGFNAWEIEHFRDMLSRIEMLAAEAGVDGEPSTETG